MHYRIKGLWVFMPWIILLPSFLINIAIAYFVDEPIYTGGIASIFFFMLFVGIISLVQTFPFALGLSVRRTDYFWGTAIMAAIISTASSIALFLLSFIESKTTDGWGLKLHYFHLPYVNDGTAIEQVWIYMMAMMHLFFLGFLTSSIFRRFGRSGMYILTAVGLVICSICGFMITYNQWWGSIFNWFASHTAFGLALWTMPLTAIYAVLSFLMLRKSTV